MEKVPAGQDFLLHLWEREEAVPQQGKSQVAHSVLMVAEQVVLCWQAGLQQNGVLS